PDYTLYGLNINFTQACLAICLFRVSAIADHRYNGLVIDQYVESNILIDLVVFFSLYTLAYLLADHLILLFIICFLHEISISILNTVCVPVVNQFITEQRKGEGMGYFVMSVNLVIVLGPLLGLSLIEYWSYVEVSTLLIALVFIGFGFCFLIPVKEPEKFAGHSNQKSIALTDLVEKKVLPIAVLAMLISFSYASIMSFIAPFAESKNLMAYAGLFFVVLAISMLSLRPLTGKVYDRKGL